MSGSPPLRDRYSKIQPDLPLLSCDRKHSLAKILPSVVKPLEVKNVCQELCSADELVKRWLSCCASCRRQKGLKAVFAGRPQHPPLPLELEAVAVRWWVADCPSPAAKGERLSAAQQVHPEHQRSPMIRVPASLALYDKPYFSSYLHTYPSPYLGPSAPKPLLLQPELSSFGRECQSIARGHRRELR